MCKTISTTGSWQVIQPDRLQAAKCQQLTVSICYRCQSFMFYPDCPHMVSWRNGSFTFHFAIHYSTAQHRKAQHSTAQRSSAAQAYLAWHHPTSLPPVSAAQSAAGMVADSLCLGRSTYRSWLCVCTSAPPQHFGRSHQPWQPLHCHNVN